MQKNAEISDVTSTGMQLKAELQNLLNQVEVAKQNLEEKRNREKSRITDRMQEILKEIEECDNILKQPAPEPGWRTGRFCKNGHENCVNIPNDEIRTVWLPPSQQEIFQYNEKIKNVQALKDKLTTELAQLQQEYNKLEEGFSSDSEYQSAVSYLNKCQQQVENQQQKIAENEELSKRKEQEYNDLSEEENQLHEAIEKTQITTNNLSNELTSMDSEVATARTRWMDAELQLQNITEQLQQMQFEAQNSRMSDSISHSMANSEMEQTQPRQFANNANLTPSIWEGLKRLAQQEVQEEREALNQISENLTKTAKDLAAPIKEGLNNVKEIFHGLEIQDFYPYPGAALTKLIMNKVDEIVETPTQEHAEDFIMDNSKRSHGM